MSQGNFFDKKPDVKQIHMEFQIPIGFVHPLHKIPTLQPLTQMYGQAIV